MNTLEGRIVAITGGFGSLGLATARVLAGRGARIALIGHGGKQDALPAPLADACIVTGIDLADAKSAQTAMDAIVEQMGGLHALVNVAGAFTWQTIADGGADTWQAMFDVNVKTALNASKAALAALSANEGGRIVNVGALAAMKAGMGMGAYAASKAALLRLTEALAEELKDRGVTVNAVLPSIIDTPPNRRDMPDADFSRWVKPEELGAVIAFLLSPDAQCITGAAIPVSGRV
ncbi:3-ketoacyl-ACP reductase (plasmid) [Burkholderia sp. SFA1]|uniref:SDR family oxidoreductase n=1 Tax=unclassified Caballeronia TaxID=2646786 RepID=UPI001F40B533|nr:MULTISPECIES: SDR family NAD(P)-dependent oxidoreductase [unclassified Caballeronia]MCE4546128.1 SDR family oxidoreductase [Caballeronia sp. PC1]MCE4573397.1 SDR family oxidoreductase [Caballeronia sp. CLC5]BBQ01408.1 3-ketoacyl-ACP reductase [Burkholderia sp. SFA1]